MVPYTVTGLNIHPVKSLKAVSVNQAEVDSFGFSFDRRFMLVNSEGQFVTQRKHPVLSRIGAVYNGRSLELNLEGKGFKFNVDEFNDRKGVSVWSDAVEALCITDSRTDAISRFVGLDVALAYMPDSTFRQVDRDFYSADQAVSFADAFPFLLANEASLGDLNEKLELPVGMGRFRPNIVFRGNRPFEEDSWKRISIGDVEFEVVKPCSRCVMTCIDEQGVRGKEPLATLASYRKNEFGVCFGQNMVQLNKGTIKVGDELRVIE